MGELIQKPDTDLIKRNWIWEIHKNCDALLHQRLAAFTTAQSMALASFTVLTVARFTANPCLINPERIFLLDLSRITVVIFGLYLSYAAYMVVAPMLMRLDYLNDKYFFPDESIDKELGSIYKGYIKCIEDENVISAFKTRVGRAALGNLLPWRWSPESYRNIIGVRLPTAEFLFWVVLAIFLVIGIIITWFGEDPARVCPAAPT